MLEIRVLTPEEIPLANPIWAQAFHHGERRDSVGDWVDTTHGKSYTCGVFDSAGLQAVVVVNDYRIYLADRAVVPMGGIGGVACMPAVRGKGYAGKCLEFTIAQMRETGHITSTLFPFSFDYYRRFGWEWVGTKRDYSVSPTILPSSPETEFCRVATEQDTPAIRQMYETFVTQYRGCLQRAERAWDILKDRADHYTYTYLYERDGKAEGYLVIRHSKQDKTPIREFIALTGRAQRGLLGLLKRHTMQTDKFTWSAPIDDTLWSQFYHWDIGTTLQPCTQGRVVDFSPALEAWKPDADQSGSVVIALHDANADWNTGTWHVEFEAGNVTVKRTTATPQLSLDIQAMSQAYFGSPTLDAIRQADRLQVHDEQGYQAFQNLMRGATMWMNDEF